MQCNTHNTAYNHEPRRAGQEGLTATNVTCWTYEQAMLPATLPENPWHGSHTSGPICVLRVLAGHSETVNKHSIHHE